MGLIRSFTKIEQIISPPPKSVPKIIEIESQNSVVLMCGMNSQPSAEIKDSINKSGNTYASPEAAAVKISFTVLALFLSRNDGDMSLDIEQYGTCDNVEQVFHNKYIISIYAINPFVETPHSFTGINSRNIDTIIEMPPANIYGLRLPHLPRVLSLIKPITGSVTASHNFAIINIVVAIFIGMPIVVMYLTRIHDISATPPPSIRPPMP